MEERFRLIRHKGKTIVLIDLSNLEDEKEITRLVKMRSTLRVKHGLLVDLTNTHFSRGIMKEAKDNAKAVRPLIRAFAVVGMLVSAVSRSSGMNIATFENRGSAMDWLAKEIAKQ